MLSVANRLALTSLRLNSPAGGRVQSMSGQRFCISRFGVSHGLVMFEIDDWQA